MQTHRFSPALLAILMACGSNQLDEPAEDPSLVADGEHELHTQAPARAAPDSVDQGEDEVEVDEDAGESYGDAGVIEPWVPPEPSPGLDPDLPVYSGGECEPFAVARARPVEYEPAPLDLTVRQAIAATQEAMTGTWLGTAKAPEGWLPDEWEVKLELRGDGTYDATAYRTVYDSPAFYYGSDLPCDLKRWRLDHVSLDGVGGEIDITFQYPPEGCYEAGWQGELHDIAFDASRERLTFQFSTDEDYGPVVYELYRACE